MNVGVVNPEKEIISLKKYMEALVKYKKILEKTQKHIDKLIERTKWMIVAYTPIPCTFGEKSTKMRRWKNE